MIIAQPFQHEEVLGIKFGYKLIGRPKMSVYMYFVDGLLIDTGQSRMRKRITAEVSKLDVEQLFITHHHEDHSGNIGAIRQLHDCEVYASESCCQLMKNPPALSFSQWFTWGSRPGQNDILPKGNTIETKRFRFSIIPIPGHAPDMVALYEPDRRWLFSADLYINSYIDYFLNDESIADQIVSIKRVLQLDFKELFCSHKPQLKNGRQKLTKKLHFLESFYHEVSLLYHKGCSDTEIFSRLQLKENWFVRILSGGKLSKLNMVKSVIRDLESV